MNEARSRRRVHPCFPTASPTAAPSTSPRRCWTASTATTACSAKPALPPSAASNADWHGQQRAQAQRIEFYDQRVNEAVERLRRRFNIEKLSMDTWQQAKLHYIGLLTDHHQPELAETFFNSVTAKLLHRSYFRNDFIFVRPAVSTEYIENDEPGSLPTYRAYYPTKENLHATWARIIHNFQLQASSRTWSATWITSSRR
jgi:isocitrate dehydrogenase kinase/phosphatase